MATAVGGGDEPPDEFELGRLRVERRRNAQMPINEDGCRVLTDRNSRTAADHSAPTTARLDVLELRIPLIWSLKQHFKQKNDARRYCVFAVLSACNRAVATPLARAVHAAHTDVQLVAAHDAPIIFDKVPPGVRVDVDVYATREDAAGQLGSDPPRSSDAESPRPVTPTGTGGGARLANIKGSLTRSLGAKFGTFAGRQHGGRPSTLLADRRSSPESSCSSGGFGAQFHLVASGCLSLDEVVNGEKETAVSSLAVSLSAVDFHSDDNVCPPLDTTLCCRVKLWPRSVAAPVCSSFAEIKLPDGCMASGHFVLHRGAVRPSSDVAGLPFVFQVNAGTICQIGRQRRMVIVTVPRPPGDRHCSPARSQQFVLVVDDVLLWQDAFRQMIRDIATWGRWAEADDAPAPVDVGGGTVQRRRSQRLAAATGRSLYDQISINTSREDNPANRPLVDYRCLRAPWLDASVMAVANGGYTQQAGDHDDDADSPLPTAVQMRRHAPSQTAMTDKRARRRSLTAMLFRQKND